MVGHPGVRRAAQSATQSATRSATVSLADVTMSLPAFASFMLRQIVHGPVAAQDWAYDKYKHQKGVFVSRGPLKQLLLYDQADVAFVYRNEGPTPFSAATLLWPLQQYWAEDVAKAKAKAKAEAGAAGGEGGEEKRNLSSALLTNDERWRSARDLLGDGMNSASTERYLPSINAASKHAVDHIADPFYAGVGGMTQWCNFAAFDAFSAVALGVNPGSTDPASEHELKALVPYDAQALGTATALAFQPAWAHPKNGYETMSFALDRIREISVSAIASMDIMRSGAPDSWFKHLVDKEGLGEEEVANLMPIFLSAGIGTTTGVLQWQILNLALPKNSAVQDRLHDELVASGAASFGKDVKLPYLKAVMKESHRLTPVAAQFGLRKLDREILLPSSGITVPPGTLCGLVSASVTRDQDVVDDVGHFKPERFLRDAKKARKGCPASVIDHPTAAHPFSMGARVCMGKRAAELEMSSLLFELFLRYKVTTVLEKPSWKFKQGTVGMPDPFPAVVFEERHH